MPVVTVLKSAAVVPMFATVVTVSRLAKRVLAILSVPAATVSRSVAQVLSVPLPALAGTVPSSATPEPVALSTAPAVGVCKDICVYF